MCLKPPSEDSGLRPVAPPVPGTPLLSGRNVGRGLQPEHRNQRENTFKLPPNLPAICRGSVTQPWQPSETRHLRKCLQREEETWLSLEIVGGWGRKLQSPFSLLRAILGGSGEPTAFGGKAWCHSAHPSTRSGDYSKKNVKFRFSFWGSRINYHPTTCVTSQFPIAISIFLNRNFQTPVLV